METKKSNKADIEKYRPMSFMLGVLVALSLLLAALEYSTSESDDTDFGDITDEMTQELELAPAIDQSDMVAAEAPQPKSVTEKIKAVESETDNAGNMSSATSDLLIGEGEGQAADATVTQAVPQIPVAASDSAVLTTVEKLPEFPGGVVEFMKWLTANLKYPELAQKNKIQGKVVVSFIVNKDGSISSPKIQKSVDPILDDEALRVIRRMPRWKPGIMDAKPCRTMFAIPVVFKI